MFPLLWDTITSLYNQGRWVPPGSVALETELTSICSLCQRCSISPDCLWAREESLHGHLARWRSLKKQNKTKQKIQDATAAVSWHSEPVVQAVLGIIFGQRLGILLPEGQKPIPPFCCHLNSSFYLPPRVCVCVCVHLRAHKYGWVSCALAGTNQNFLPQVAPGPS